MKRKRLMLFAIAAISLSLAYQSRGEEDADNPPPVPAQEQPEVLTKGPVHEAFASPVNLKDSDGITVKVQPPANIQEVPPADRPAGEQFTWVSGYWSWDTDHNGFIWISGCWRAAPPKMSWVPGYWARTEIGWKWVAGFWLQTGVKEIEYVKEPPAIFDMEPSLQAPGSDLVWVPSCWYWSNGQYVLRSGYWLQGQPGWIWSPSHYLWTPHGYVFSEGHWDYPLERRGVLFAPVCFPRNFRVQPGFSYPLSIVVDIGLLKVNLFTCPRYSHYYFGDYYDDIYMRVGIYPRFEGGRRYSCYDPVFEHDKWRGRLQDPRWEDHERRDYELRRDNRELRPSVTYREQESRISKLQELQRKKVQVAQPISTVVHEKKTPQKFERMDADVQRKISKQGNDLQQYREERKSWESKPGNTIKPGKEPVERADPAAPANAGRNPASPSPERIKVPASPIAGWQAPGNTGEVLPANPAGERGGRNDDRGVSRDRGVPDRR
ncbi:MAG TPA: hypothetical protein DET40_10230 [Lentisphaeria bacterium]|nr:MAG: hypothetical protein A2X45_10050 [Lentisphaerae bacterium GWF2_50_93]HCE43913.1 hypothetical protein [Lentisphaeria bacterium]